MLNHHIDKGNCHFQSKSMREFVDLAGIERRLIACNSYDHDMADFYSKMSGTTTADANPLCIISCLLSSTDDFAQIVDDWLGLKVSSSEGDVPVGTDKD